ncbi:hypothetical protein HNQ57_001864 [Zhongshania antarctica]|uniref:Nitrogen fixation protein FixH n=1 Tax=Zhongshania antarctica TaxID=641702 RepID=A0A840R3A3_9GAMM|nr:FixH family protein [Zhongshania antarctica]MBB5187595.1 hypothetical protein [Zhongshania antarctica]
MTANVSMQIKHGASEKWYRQFWPWFLIVLPGTVVIASIITLVIAIIHSDNLVRDDYYKDGLAINRYLEQDAFASQMQLSAGGQLTNGDIEITLKGTALTEYNQLLLLWQHPTSEELDFQTVLINDGENHYSAQLTQSITGRWYLTLASFNNNEASRWRLKTEFDTDHTQQFVMDDQANNQGAKTP